MESAQAKITEEEDAILRTESAKIRREEIRADERAGTGKIMAIQEQSTMKELCAMMEDHIWMLDIGEIFKHSRYILWLTPDSASQSGSAIERQINQLQEFVEDRAEQSDTKVLRELALLREDLEGIKTQLADIERNNEDDEDSY